MAMHGGTVLVAWKEAHTMYGPTLSSHVDSLRHVKVSGVPHMLMCLDMGSGAL